MNASKQSEAFKSEQISAMEQELRSTKEMLLTSKNVVDNYKKAEIELEVKSEDRIKKLLVLKELAAMSSAKLEDLQKEVNEWQSKAVESDACCLELNEKVCGFFTRK